MHKDPLIYFSFSALLWACSHPVSPAKSDTGTPPPVVNVDASPPPKTPTPAASPPPAPSAPAAVASVEPPEFPTMTPPPVGAMVRLEGGSFRMGSNSGENDEKPEHLVKVAAFEMDATETTVQEYKECVDAKVCAEPRAEKACNWGVKGRENHPMNCIEWLEARAYCEFKKKRLPIEEEWEYAARGPKGRTYPWGEESPDGRVCWNRAKHPQKTCPVGAFPLGNTPTGIFDLAGNVGEWTESMYSERYDQERTNRVTVYRSGTWLFSDPKRMRGAYRLNQAPNGYHVGLGVRCVRSVVP